MLNVGISNAMRTLKITTVIKRAHTQPQKQLFRETHKYITSTTNIPENTTEFKGRES